MLVAVLTRVGITCLHVFVVCVCQLQAYLRACATGCIAQVVALEARLAGLLRYELLTPYAVDGAIRNVRIKGMQAACECGHVAVVKYLFGSGGDRTVPLPDLKPIVSDEVCGVDCQPSTDALLLI